MNGLFIFSHLFIILFCLYAKMNEMFEKYWGKIHGNDREIFRLC